MMLMMMRSISDDEDDGDDGMRMMISYTTNSNVTTNILNYNKCNISNIAATAILIYKHKCAVTIIKDFFPIQTHD